MTVPEVLVGFPDIEETVMALLDPIAPADTVTPEKITTPVIRVLRVGGSDNGITDFPRVEVSCFAPTRNQAREMSELCRQVILASKASSVEIPDGPTVYIDNARTDTPPQQVPYDNPDLTRAQAYYRFALRRPRQS